METQKSEANMDVDTKASVYANIFILRDISLGGTSCNVEVFPCPRAQIYPKACCQTPGPGHPKETKESQGPQRDWDTGCIVHSCDGGRRERWAFRKEWKWSWNLCARHTTNFLRNQIKRQLFKRPQRELRFCFSILPKLLPMKSAHVSAAHTDTCPSSLHNLSPRTRFTHNLPTSRWTEATSPFTRKTRRLGTTCRWLCFASSVEVFES